MLLSLISVLVLLVIAFYAVWIGATGRVGGNEGAELTVGGRALVIGFALVAFGAAYAVYSHPRSEGLLAASSVPATPSNPPESRGLKVAETTILDPGVDADATPAAGRDAASESGAGKVTAEAVAESQAGEAAPAKVPVAAASPVVASEEAEGLSAGAALLEAQALRSRRPLPETAPVVASPASKTSAPLPSAATTRLAAVDQPTPARVSKPAPRSSTRSGSGRTRVASAPLTLHVHNALGASQQREQLTLSIEGLAVADIEVDGSRPAVSVAVPLPRPGLLHYRLRGLSEGDDTLQLAGEGCIRVRDGARFVVRRKEGSRKVFLEQLRAAG